MNNVDAEDVSDDDLQDALNRRRRRSSDEGLSAIVAQFEAIYGVNTDGNTNGTSNALEVQDDVQDRVSDTVTSLETMDASSRQWKGQGLNILVTPRQDQIYAKYVKYYRFRVIYQCYV